MTDNDLQLETYGLAAHCVQAAPETAADVAAEQRPSRPKRRGAEFGNRRAARHGLRMVAGRLPEGAAWIRRETDDIRRRLEDAVIETAGELSIASVATINEVVVWERHRLLVSRWLRIEGDKLNHDQRLAYSREVAKSATERNKALRLLTLDSRTLDPWATLTIPAAPMPAESATGAQEGNRADA